MNWRQIQGYYGWDLPGASFAQIIVAMWNANLDGVKQIIEAHPEIVDADELLQSASRPPGHWHHGHGGEVPPDKGRDEKRAEIVAWLIEKGADPNKRSRRRRDLGLHQAARFGLAETIRVHLANGADPNVRAKDGATALHRAVKFKYQAAVDVLMAGGADATIADNRGRTPADLAEEKGVSLG